jgi:hypothetical protein
MTTRLRALDPAVFPARVNLLLQREDTVGQPVSGHVDSSQAALFQEIYLVGQSRDIGSSTGVGCSLHDP